MNARNGEDEADDDDDDDGDNEEDGDDTLFILFLRVGETIVCHILFLRSFNLSVFLSFFLL